MKKSTRIPTPKELLSRFNKLFELIRQQNPADHEDVWFGMHLGHEKSGTLTSLSLRGEAAENYQELLGALWAATHWGRRGSRDRLTRILHRFLLEMALNSDASGERRDDIFRTCGAKLDEELGGHIRRWWLIVRVPVRIYVQHDHVRLSDLDFRCMTDVQRRILERRIRKTLGHNKGHQAAVIGQLSNMLGRDVVCEGIFEARDAKHAFVVAQEQIGNRLDFYAGITALLRRPTDPRNDPRRRSGPGVAIDIATGHAEGYGLGAAADEVDLTAVAEQKNRPIVRTLLALPDKKNLTGGEVRLLDTLQWSGRSRRSDNEASAYLCAAIAYETLLKGHGALGVSYALRLRCAQLIGTTRAGKRAVFQVAMDAYSKRSAIVHADYATIDLNELTAFWALLNRAIVAFIARRFHRRSNSDIEEWFEKHLL